MANGFTLSLKNDFATFARHVDERADRFLPLATSRALTDTARELAGVLTAEIPDIFAKATPFTKHAIGFTGSSRAKPEASVFVRAIQSRYLLHEEIGGERLPSENTTKASQALVLPGSTRLKTLPGLKRNSYDNIPYRALERLRMLAAQTAADHREIRANAAFGGKLKGRRLQQTAAGAAGVIFLTAEQVPAAFEKIGGYFRRGPDHKLYRLTTFEAGVHYHPKFGFRQRFEHHGSLLFRKHMRARLAEALKGT